MERQHAPVHDIGTITLCSVILCDVCKSADDSLAGSCLFSCGTVARLVCVDRGTDLDIAQISVFAARDRMDDFEYFLEFRSFCHDVFAVSSCDLKCVYNLCLADISGISSGQCEFCQTQRVGTVAGCFTGRDQFVCCCNFIKDLGAYLQEYVLAEGMTLRPVFDVRSVEQIL